MSGSGNLQPAERWLHPIPSHPIAPALTALLWLCNAVVVQIGALQPSDVTPPKPPPLRDEDEDDDEEEEEEEEEDPGAGVRKQHTTPRVLQPDKGPVEVLYEALLPIMTPVVLSLLKLFLAALPNATSVHIDLWSDLVGGMEGFEEQNPELEGQLQAGVCPVFPLFVIECLCCCDQGIDRSQHAVVNLALGTSPNGSASNRTRSKAGNGRELEFCKHPPPTGDRS